MSDSNTAVEDSPFLGHLFELRDRLLRSVLVIIVLMVPLFYFANDLFTFVAEPMLRSLPEGSQMIATGVASPFLTPFKLSIVAAIFIAVPYLLHQVWSFISPGLYSHERSLVVPLLVSSTVLFYCGIAFAYFVVLPLVFAFFTAVTPEGVNFLPDISQYLDFMLKMLLAFGVAFEVPIATILLCWTGMTTPDKLASKRAYVVVGAFIIGMLLTPPDIISQTLMAIPMWLLFEIGVFFSRRIVSRKRQRQAEEDREFEENSIMPDEAVAAEVAETETTDASVSSFVAEDITSEDANDLDEPFVEMSDEDMDAELDKMDDEDEDDEKPDDSDDDTPPAKS